MLTCCAPALADKVRIKEGSNPNVRSKPSTEGEIVEHARSGQTYELMDTSDNWYKIKMSDGTVGWISGGMVDEVIRETAQPSADTSSSAQTPAQTGSVTEPRYEAAILMRQMYKNKAGLNANYRQYGDLDGILCGVRMGDRPDVPKINVLALFEKDNPLSNMYVDAEYVTFDDKDLDLMYQLASEATNPYGYGSIRFVVFPEHHIISAQTNQFIVSEDTAYLAFGLLFTACVEAYSLFAPYDVTER